MKITNRLLCLLLLFAIMAFPNVYANQDNFGLSTTVVTTSVVKKVQKNLGKLRVSISTSCHASAEEASQMIQTVKNDIQGKAESELTRLGVVGVALDEDSSVENPRSSNQYVLGYPERDSTVMVYTDRCSEKHTSLSGLNIDEINELNAAEVYSSNLTMTYVATEEISKLLELKQFLADVVSELNETSKDEMA